MTGRGFFCGVILLLGIVSIAEANEYDPFGARLTREKEGGFKVDGLSSAGMAKQLNFQGGEVLLKLFDNPITNPSEFRRSILGKTDIVLVRKRGDVTEKVTAKLHWPPAELHPNSLTKTQAALRDKPGYAPIVISLKIEKLP